MDFCRLRIDNREEWCLLEESGALVISGAPWSSWEMTGEKVDLFGRRFLFPAAPKNIVGIGKNYRSNFKEGESYPEKPILFWKGVGTLASHEDIVNLPDYSNKVFIEGELVLVVGKTAKNVSVEDAMEYVFGYTCSNDLTAVDMLEKGMKWFEAKSGDGFLPVGPIVTTSISENARLQTFLNGERVQDATIDQLVFSPAELVSYVSSILTLHPGDLISTGSPAGRQVVSGDEVEVRLQGVGALKNHFR